MTHLGSIIVAGAAFAALAGANPASALDLGKVQNLVGQGWTATKTTPDLVQFACTSPVCPPSGGLAVALSPAPDAARDEMIVDPEKSLAGYKSGFSKTPTAKACEFSNFTSEKAGESGARVEMDGECPSGLLVMMATMFDKAQPGTISIVASSMDAAKAKAVRAQAVQALGEALKAAQ